MTTRTAFRTCPLCEATCGLEITVRDGAVTRIRGDRDDVFSHGFICPKGSTLKQLHDDPDRLRVPLVRRDGALERATWDEAFAEIERRLTAVVDAHGRDAVAVYLGNPNAHQLDGIMYARHLIRALATTNVFSASTVDQRPKEISSGLLFGAPATIPVPDLDRTSFAILIGANPYESNGSLATAPDWPGRLERLVARGGTLVVIDPTRTRTAEAATRHVRIRPGTDALLLMAMVNVLFEQGLVDLGATDGMVEGVDTLREVSRPFTPEAVEAACGVDAPTIRALTGDLAGAPAGVVYGRIGSCTQEFGTLASWLVDVLNILTGNLDRPGGAMFATPAAGGPNTRGTPRVGRGLRLGRRRSRVRGLAESLGELPVACLAEEIDTPGDGQIRALFTLGGNPARSTPNSDRLERALATLDLLVSVDIYLNETTRHADVILPAPSALTRSHYDLALYQFGLRNVANYSPPVLPPEDGAMEEWRILAKLALIAQGQGAGADPAALDDLVIRGMAESGGRDPDEVVAELGERVGPDRILDLMLRTGPHQLTLDDLVAHPHGIDFGPLQPRLPDVLRTPSGMIELAPEALVADVARLSAAMHRAERDRFVLIGRRQLRSNNSWMHNIDVLVKGKPRCTLLIHPADAADLGLAPDDLARVTSRAGTLVAPIEITDDAMPGVVSLPHGWGHDVDGVDMHVARAHGGVNSNVLADETLVDALSGNAVLNGIPVSISAAG